MQRRPPQTRGLYQHEFQRTYKACIPCARRKVKCEPAEGGKCVRCKKKSIDCLFTTKKPWARGARNTPEGTTGPNSRIDDTTSPRLRSVSDHEHGNQEDGLPTSMLQKVVTSNKDALEILFDAAIRDESQSQLNNSLATNPTPPLPPVATDADALRIWNAYRFVKMGWFSAQEAMALVDLFFRNMNPLSPILTDFFASPQNHFYLVTQEPLLCCTILMISSRYHNLPGVGGCSRAIFIHQRLWQHCQHLLLRVTLGQEKVSKAKTRNIGSAEALLLMSEWHPRSLQFPPDSDGWDSDYLLTQLDARDPPCDEGIPVSARWREDIVEPTMRFERMSWMILNSALALTHELGAFDPIIHVPVQDNTLGPDTEHYLANLKLRTERIRPLLFVFINVLSSRIGCTSPMPSATGVLNPESTSLLRKSNKEWLSFMTSWIELTKMASSVMDTMFPQMNMSLSSDPTDNFLAMLEEKQALLADWRQRNLVGCTPSTRTDILFVEYQHLRILVNSIGMQRIVQKVLAQTNFCSNLTIDHSFIDKARHINMTGREYGFIEEVIDGCCQTLEKVSTLGVTGSLQYSPMRILLRTISSSIFLMKALALGVRNTKLKEALQIFDQAIAAMQDGSQDDVHLMTQYANLLKTQATRFRSSLVSSTRISSSSQPRGGDPGKGICGSDILNLDQQSLQTDYRTTGNAEIEESLGSDVNDWLSLPFDPSMAPFGSYEPDLGLRLDGVDLDLDFLWLLPP